jgi:hypothetical protein
MATRKMKTLKKQSFEMLIATKLGAVMAIFLDGKTIELKTLQDGPIKFFNVAWHVWLKMRKQGRKWAPSHELGSIRSGEKQNACRADRTQLSKNGAQRVLSELIECVNGVCLQDDFIKNLEEADRRENMKRLADLRARKIELQSQLELVEIEISEIERFTI